jgi:hypothetical protein
MLMVLEEVTRESRNLNRPGISFPNDFRNIKGSQRNAHAGEK